MESKKKVLWTFLKVIIIISIVEFVIMRFISNLTINQNFVYIIDVTSFALISILFLYVFAWKDILRISSENDQVSMILNEMSQLTFLVKVEDQDRYRCVHVNDTYLTTLGKKRGEVLGKYLEQFLPEKEVNNIKKSIEKPSI